MKDFHEMQSKNPSRSGGSFRSGWQANFVRSARSGPGRTPGRGFLSRMQVRTIPTHAYAANPGISSSSLRLLIS